MMFTRITIIIFLKLLSLGVLFFGYTKFFKDQNIEAAVLVEDYYPWVYFNKDTGKYEGFDVEVAEMIASKLGYKIDFTYLPSNNLYQGIAQDQFDLFVGRMYNNDTFKDKLYLTENYTASDFVFWGHEAFYQKYNVSNLDLKNLPSFMAFSSNKTFAMTADKKEYSLVEKYLNGLSDVDLYSSQQQLFDAMRQKDLMAVSDWQYVKHIMEETKAEYLPLGRTIMREEINEFVGTGEVIGVTLDDPVLYTKVNELLRELKQDGSLEEISFKYFGSDVISR